MTASKPQITRIAAYGLIQQEGQILLCRLSAQLPRDVGRWTLPGGGIDFGEEPVDAMVREVYEETGLSVRADGLAGIDSFHVEGEQRDFHGIRILYHATVTGGTLRNELDGTTDLCQWWSMEEVGQLPVVDLVEVGLKLGFAR